MFIVLAVFVSGCKKDSDNNPKQGAPPNNQVKTCRLIRSDHTSGGYTTYDYDLNSRIKSLRQFVPGSGSTSGRNTAYVFDRDAKNRVFKIVGGTESASAIKNVDEFEYDSNSRWIKTTSGSIPASTYFSVTVPEYNSQGLIEKITYTAQNGSNSQVTVRNYEYKDGNLNSLRETLGNRITTSYFEYYLDRPRRISELDSLNSYYMGLGTLSKNMLKSIRTFDQTNVMETTYTYVFMGADYVQVETMKTVLNGSAAGNYEAVKTYNCD